MTLKRLGKILLFSLLFLVVLVVSAAYFIQRDFTQNYLAQKAVSYLKGKLNTDVAIKKVSIDFKNNIHFEGLYIADSKKDTLLYVEDFSFRFNDWFYIKKTKPEISEIKLSNAVINMNRAKDTNIWNYDFIIDAFSSGNSTSDTIVKSNNKQQDFEFDLKKVKFNKIRFNYIDKWAGQNFNIALNSFLLDANKIDNKTKQFDLNEIFFEQPVIVFQDYKGGKPPKKHERDTTVFNDEYWKISLKSLKIKDGNFNYDYEFDKPTPNLFDEKHVYASAINLDLKNVGILGDTIKAKFNEFSAKERSGLVVKSLVSDVTLSPVKAKLSDLKLVTNNSVIADYYEMDYSNFTDFQDYINKVVMKANFDNSYIDFKDIAYFSKEILDLNFKNASLKKGNFTGTVEKFVARNLDVRAGNSTLVGDLAMKGLPDINTTFIDLNAKQLSTSGTELQKFVPEVKNEAIDFRELGNINFVGNYKGYIDDFVTKGNLKTDLGQANSDIHLTFKKNAQPTYDGYVATNGFQLGKLLKTNQVGLIALKGNVKGSGFDLKNINTVVDANVYKFETEAHTYTDITVNGKIFNNKFIGKIDSKDPALVMNFDGELNLNGENPDYKLKSRVANFDLQALGLSSEPIKGSAIMDLNFTGKSIDEFLGKAKLYELYLQNGNKRIYLDSAILRSFVNNGEKTLTLNSSAANAVLKGKFNVEELPTAMQLYLSYYLPEYIKRPKISAPQQFDYDVELFDVTNLVSVFLPDLKSINNSKIDGSLNMITQSLNLNISSPLFAYKDIGVRDILLKGVGNYSKLDIIGSTGNLFNKEQLVVPSSNFNSSLFNDSATVQINTAGGLYDVKDAKLDIKGFASNNTFYLNILPSEFYIKESKWKVMNGNNFVVFDKNGLQEVRGLTLLSGAQQIVVNSEEENNKNIIAKISNLDINELSGLAGMKSNTILGRANGEVRVNDFLNNNIISGNIKTTPLIYLNDTIGALSLDATYNQTSQEVIINNSSGLLYNENKTSVAGKIFLKDSVQNLDVEVALNGAPAKILEKFMGDFIQSTDGIVNGDITVTGKLTDPNFRGKLKAYDFITKIIMLNTVYRIPQMNIDVTKNEFKIEENTKIYDEDGRMANIYEGSIKHKLFDNFKLNIGINTGSFLFLNTNETQNKVYYGKVVASGEVVINGPLNYLTMDILGRAQKGTHLYLPLNTTIESEKLDFIKFKTYGKLDNGETEKVNNSRLFVNIRAESSPDAAVTIITDPNSGERIDANGTTNDFAMNIDVGNDVSITGSYVIEKGNYNYKFKGLVNKDFAIEPSSSIIWTGDPLDAQMNVTATYTSNTDKSIDALYETPPSSADANAYRKFKTQIQITLDGKLSSPIPKYKIIQPENTDESSMAFQRLQRLNDNEQDQLAQIGYLLLADNFINNFQQAISGSITNTVNDLVAPTLSNIVTNTFQKLSGFKNTTINLRYNNQGDSLSAFNSNQLKLNVQQTFLNDRLRIQIGNSINYSNNVANTSALKYNFDDIKLQYLLSNRGQFRLNAFHTRNSDISNIINGENSAVNGVGFSYKKSFNTIFEFMPWMFPNRYDTIGVGTN